MAEELDSTVGYVVYYSMIYGVSDSPAVSSSSRSALKNQVEDLALAINTNVFMMIQRSWTNMIFELGSQYHKIIV